MSFSTSTQFVSARRMGVYLPEHHHHHMDGIWGDSSKVESTGASSVVEPDAKLDNRSSEDGSQRERSKKYDQEENIPRDKVMRRLAQNREAARRSRLKKKAYVQQLETSSIKLSQLEQELQKARQQVMPSMAMHVLKKEPTGKIKSTCLWQGLYLGGDPEGSSYGLSPPVDNDIAAFEMEYAHWVEEQKRQNGELRAALQQHVSDIELRILVESGMRHYDDLFRIKKVAAKSDVFYVMSGMWKTPTERFFLWIGGFRPSELLKILCPLIDPLTDQQLVGVCNLQQSCAQAEDALSQGMERLQQTLADTLVGSEAPSSSGVPNHVGKMTAAMEKLEALVNFVNQQADHLRHQTMHQMYRILTTRQAARGLLVLGDYLQRLRALSSIWTARPRETT